MYREQERARRAARFETWLRHRWPDDPDIERHVAFWRAHFLSGL
jgi:hypothetical protein